MARVNNNRLLFEQWQVGSGEWAVASGQWQVGSGEWAVASGQWQVGSGEWQMMVSIAKTPLQWATAVGHCSGPLQWQKEKTVIIYFSRQEF